MKNHNTIKSNIKKGSVETNLPSLHPKTHKLLAKTLGMAAASLSDNSFQVTLARLILLLESYGKVNPVIPSTIVGPAANSDLDSLAADINERWNFPAGKNYKRGSDIDGTEPTQTLARDIDNRGGVVNGK
jgi:hypothetical protein